MSMTHICWLWSGWVWLSWPEEEQRRPGLGRLPQESTPGVPVNHALPPEALEPGRDLVIEPSATPTTNNGALDKLPNLSEFQLPRL